MSSAICAFNSSISCGMTKGSKSGQLTNILDILLKIWSLKFRLLLEIGTLGLPWGKKGNPAKMPQHSWRNQDGVRSLKPLGEMIDGDKMHLFWI